MDNTALLAALNAFTRREHTEDEVYLFTITLCDNEVDRDGERFSLEALSQLQKLFVGKTGIFDHNAKGTNQTARIFATELLETPDVTTTVGEPYTALKGNAYMIRTASNADLIKEIDGGIKKEVSISCRAESSKCSICGADKKKKPCSHVNGKTYNSKPCYTLLGNIKDAYEWSFVAVPAQVNAGVTKFFSNNAVGVATRDEENTSQVIDSELLSKIYEGTKAEVIKLGFLAQPGVPTATLGRVIENMTLSQLYDLKKAFLNEVWGELKPQLTANYDSANEKRNASFKLA